uniref:Protein phosphatase n=1 Tax=Caenorhabditis tropicalis TaxID=1561998 RepID=A0A1I7TM84_9PELO
MVAGVRLLAYGRLAVRAVFSASALDLGSSIGPEAISSGRRGFSSSTSKPGKPTKEGSPSPASSPHVENVIASCAGFPKDMLNGPSTVNDKGVFGDDAWFISRFKNTFVVGVADGVGGWRKYGIDPSAFSRRLMKECEKRVQGGEFDPKKPESLLDFAFRASAESPRPVGSSTACVLVVHQEKLYSANLGDSGFMVVRNGKIISKSREQVHYFNAPFQLTLPPEGYQGFIGDRADMADKEEMDVKKGDIILLATDGVWDNLSEQQVLDQLKALDEGKSNVQEVCNALALTARRLAFDSKHNSPFAMKAREHGFLAPGGKPDDITLVLLLIA